MGIGKAEELFWPVRHGYGPESLPGTAGHDHRHSAVRDILGHGKSVF